MNCSALSQPTKWLELQAGFVCGQINSKCYGLLRLEEALTSGLYLITKFALSVEKKLNKGSITHIKTHKMQFRGSSGRAAPLHCSRDIATFVSKQNNKTSQPVVVNFLLASIDSISVFFLSPLRDSSRYSTGESREKQRGGNGERKKRDRAPAAEKQLRTWLPQNPGRS